MGHIRQNFPSKFLYYTYGIATVLYCSYSTNRYNYNSLISAKLPHTNEDGELKSFCVDKKADNLNAN